ncbi:transporter [Cohnella candidum]
MQGPTAPPPQFVPQMSAQPFAVDPGGIRRCLYRNTYVWLVNGQQFWFFPTFVGPNSVAGYRWFGFRWSYFGIDLRIIRSFTCF